MDQAPAKKLKISAVAQAQASAGALSSGAQGLRVVSFEGTLSLARIAEDAASIPPEARTTMPP